jgi:hypothetical protein
MWKPFRSLVNFFEPCGIFSPQLPLHEHGRAFVGLACAQATAMRIDIAPHKRPRKNTLTTSPTPTTFTSLHTPTSTISNPRHRDDSTVYHSILYMGK